MSVQNFYSNPPVSCWHIFNDMTMFQLPSSSGDFRLELQWHKIFIVGFSENTTFARDVVFQIYYQLQLSNNEDNNNVIEFNT